MESNSKLNSFNWRRITKGIVIAILLPAFLYIAKVQYDEWKLRPKLVFSPQRLLLCYNKDMTCDVTLDFEIKNSGKTSIMIDKINIELYMNELDSRPFIVENEFRAKICADSIICTSINSQFNGFSDYDYDFESPESSLKFELSHVGFITVDVSGKENFRMKYPKSAVILRASAYKGESSQYLDSNFTLQDFQKIADSLEFLDIIYNNSTYRNYYYPSKYEITYEVENDSIFLEFSLTGEYLIIGPDSIEFTGSFNDLLFFEHPAIRGKVFFPRKFGLNYNAVIRSAESISEYEVEVEMPPDGMSFIYVFKSFDKE